MQPRSSSATTCARPSGNGRALDGFRELIAGADAVDVLPQVGVLLAVAIVLLALATSRLRSALTA